MRISDWRSDVCSSDLATANAGGLGILASATMTFEELEAAVAKTKSLTGKPFGVTIRADATDAGEQLGRASSRERGCQYVWISVVAVSIQKKHTDTKRKTNNSKKRADTRTKKTN